MSDFENNYEQFIRKAIHAEVGALNSEKGEKIMDDLLEAAKEANPNLTPEEWSKMKEQFLMYIFAEMLKSNPEFKKQFAHLVWQKLNTEQ